MRSIRNSALSWDETIAWSRLRKNGLATEGPMNITKISTIPSNPNAMIERRRQRLSGECGAGLVVRFELESGRSAIIALLDRQEHSRKARDRARAVYVCRAAALG